MMDFSGFITLAVRDQIMQAAPNQTGRIAEVKGGYADVTLASGAKLRHVQIGVPGWYSPGAGVTVERASNGQYQIVGAAGAESE